MSSIYTMWLKRWTAQNIVIGGAAGALPPVIGWAAVTGGVSLEPLLLFLVIFMWTPPHFWALALFTRGDYARAGMPMMPNVAGDALDAPADPCLCAAACAGRGAALAVRPCRACLWPRRPSCSGWSSSAAPSCSGGGATPIDYRAAKGLFAFSILYLFALFAVRLAEALGGAGSGAELNEPPRQLTRGTGAATAPALRGDRRRCSACSSCFSTSWRSCSGPGIMNRPLSNRPTRP